MTDFTKGNVTRQLISFALPLLISSIFQQLYNMADAIVVGNYVGSDALAAVGTSSPVLNLLLAVLMGLTTGASVLISQFYGAQQVDELRRTVSTSILFLGALSLAISLVGYLGAPLFLRLLDTPANILDDAVTYLRICMAGMLFPMFYNLYNAYLRALGNAKAPLYFLVFATLLNIALDVLLVAVLGMGVAGAAIATVFAQAVSVVFCFLYTNRHVPALRVEKLRFDAQIFRSVLQYSIPTAVQLSVVSLASLTIQRLVNGFGSIVLAGYTAATKIDSFATMPLSNLSMAVSIFVGQNMGAGLEERAKKGFRTSLLLMLGTGIAISTLAMLFGKPLISLFVDAGAADTPQILAVGAHYLSIIVAFYSFFAVFFCFTGFFRGAGDAVIVMALTITSLSIRSLTAHLLVSQFGMGAEAVAWSIPVGWGLCSLVSWWYYTHRKWAGKLARGVRGAAKDEAEAPAS